MDRPKTFRDAVAWRLSKLERRLTGAARILPDFLLIGGQRCGTTSLYNYLVRHPSVAPAFKKEIHYLDLNYPKGDRWYRSHFPTGIQRAWTERVLGRPLLAGEASAYYLFHPCAAERARTAIPNARLIALLRHPVDRAYSHYQYEVRRGRESLSFEDAIEAEPERLAGEAERIRTDAGARSYAHRRYSYLARGRYAEQLEVWLDQFPKDRLLVLLSDDLYSDPAAVLERVAAFLGLPTWSPGDFPRYNAGSYTDIAPETRRRLVDHFAPHNARLEKILELELDWNR